MPQQSHSVSEEEPLLSRRQNLPQNEDDTTSRSPNAPEEPPKKPSKWPTFTTIHPRYRFIPFLGCLIILINESEYFIKQVATMRAIEAMYCYEHYLALGSPLADLGKRIPERLCKSESIQKQLAGTAGGIMFVRMLSAIVGAVPLGWLADRWGRKVVLVLHKVNVTITCTAWLVLYLGFPKVPIWTLYLSGIPGLIGGNYDVGLAMLFAAYTDVMPSATERASLFFLTTSMQYLAQTFCPTIGAFLMNLDGHGGTPQVNLAVSLSLTVITVLVTAFLFPETLHESKKASKLPTDPENSRRPSGTEPSPPPSKKPSLLTSVTEAVSNLGLLNLFLLSLSILLSASGIKSIDWFALIQYPVIKLSWSFPLASSIVSLSGILMLLHFSLFLPFLNRLAARRLGSAGKGHFAIMMGSATFLSVGATLIGFSGSSAAFVGAVVVYLFGEGLPTATQAYIVSLIEKDKVARVMTTLSITSIGGKLVASVLFPKVLALGLDSGVPVLVGLPLFVSAGMFVVSAVCVSVVGVRMGLAGREKVDEGEGDGGSAS
ncbi:MFS general substrate transporter [Aulographum hederae CBS 113979]|uniref:MFS general substrate transporter n=1 Tax=Aulographum hederae CBS 113979 TaxID=1176131 RepID=A0A6G1HDC6_9PEZI|nr:MFS general substrate transporter [Aulographum hederae CBS 113979]